MMPEAARRAVLAATGAERAGAACTAGAVRNRGRHDGQARVPRRRARGARGPTLTPRAAITARKMFRCRNVL